MTLTDLFTQFVAANRRLRADSSLRHYRFAIQHFGRMLGHEPTLADLTDAHLVAMERYLCQKSGYTTRGYLGRLRALWRFACRTGRLTHWPQPEHLDLADPDKPTWSVEQVRQLLDAAQAQIGYYDHVPRSLWWQSFIRTLWDTGERDSAMRSCRWDWLEGDRLVIPAQARKGKRKQAIYQLTPPTLAAINLIRKPRRPVIWNWPYTISTYYNHWTTLLTSAGLPSGRKCKAQRFRRTHLTMWELGGRDATSRAMHTSRAVTERFYLDTTKMPVIDPGDVLPSL